MTIPEFSGYNTFCRKCGRDGDGMGTSAMTHWLPPENETVQVLLAAQGVSTPNPGGYMLRTCNVCRYQWLELPVDYEDEGVVRDTDTDGTTGAVTGS